MSLGCIHDDVQAEPGSWLVVGMIPVFDKKKAIRTKLWTEDGPNGAAHRRIETTHQCMKALSEEWNTLTQNTKVLQWADGPWRQSLPGSARSVYCSVPSSWTSQRQTPIVATQHSSASCVTVPRTVTGCMSMLSFPPSTRTHWRQR